MMVMPSPPQQQRVSLGFAPDFMAPVVDRMGEADLAALSDCMDIDEGINSYTMDELAQSMLEPMVQNRTKKEGHEESCADPRAR